MEEFAYNRRDFIKSSLVTGIGLAGGLMPITLHAAKPLRLTILHTNDTHSRIDPYPEGGPNAGMGGVSARIKLIEHIRATEEHVLLFDAGDIFQGTPYFNFFKGAIEMKAMEKMGYDATTMGNHDFDEGVENFAKQMKHISFPVLVSNYDFSATVLADKVQPYQVFERGKLKVGVFGLGINPVGLIPDALFGAVKYLNPLEKAKEMVNILRAQSCQLIVCLSHLGYAYRDDKVCDKRLASEVDGIDLIIGGHTHTFLDQPQLVKRANGRSTLIAQVGHSGLRLGRIDLEFGRTKVLHQWSARSLKIS